ncbi:MAG: hypothetical protein A2293_00120 [Elusimicrobia bacterium RIFOXYB2_FULL_49_7]|nr:MAG: hypothetical protein A2293_00120 [Elusimicrobia bacterium RIFOXYB2_FULL_49_7]
MFMVTVGVVYIIIYILMNKLFACSAVALGIILAMTTIFVLYRTAFFWLDHHRIFDHSIDFAVDGAKR